jgi:putative efflux protein, MATE family
MYGNKTFYKTLSSLAVPIMLQNLLASSVSFADTLMIGKLGQNAIAAVGIANQVFFLVNLFCFGIVSGLSVFLSRYYGAGNTEKMRSVTALGLSLTVAGGLIWALASLFFPEQIMHIFTREAEVVTIGAGYQRIVAVSYLFFAVSQTFSIGFRSIGKASIPLYATTFSLVLNIVGNWILIFGIGPAPALGAYGAAIATLISRFAELIILLFFTFKNVVPFRIKSRCDFKWKKDFLATYFKTSVPVFCNEMLWALGMTMYKVAISLLGVEAIAATSVTQSIADLFFVLCIGVGNAGTIMIGQRLGRGDREGTLKMGKKLMIVSLWIGIGMGILMASLAPFIPRLFNIGTELYSMIVKSLLVIAVLQPVKSLNMTAIVSLMRGAADTRFALVAEISAVWAVGVPMSFIAAALFHAPLWAVYLAQNTDEVVKLIISLFRLRTPVWIKQLPTENE